MAKFSHRQFYARRKPHHISTMLVNKAHDKGFNTVPEYLSWRSARRAEIRGNVNLGVSLAARVVFISITFGLVSLLFAHNFDFQSFMQGLVNQDFALFDYSEFLETVNGAFDELPSGLGFLKSIIQLFVSIGYVFYWLVGLIGYIFTA